MRRSPQEEKGQGAGGEGEDRDEACTPVKGGACTHVSLRSTQFFSELVPPAPFPPASSGQKTEVRIPYAS